MLTIRPKVAELVLQLYDRPLHPELFQIHRSRLLKCENYEAKIDITSAGHVLTWRTAGLTLTEVAASAQHPLSEKHLLMSCRLRDQRREVVEHRRRVRYEMEFHLETATPQAFWNLQTELAWTAARQGLLYKFDGGGRIALGAISSVQIEPRCRCLVVCACHTFPADFAIVKTRTTFELV